MDQFGEEVLAGLSPDLVPTGFEETLNDDFPGYDIDVPFTASAQRVIDRCAEYASRSGAQSVLSDHLLVAMAESPESAVAQIIVEECWSADKLLDVFQILLGYEAAPAFSPSTPSPRLERVIIRAKRLAYRYQHTEASTMHLVWALIRERAGAPIDALERQVASYEYVASGIPQTIRAQESD